MKINHTGQMYARKRRVYRPQHWATFVGLVCVVALVICYYSFVRQNNDQSGPGAQVTAVSPPRPTFSKKVQLTWPTAGEAALGSVEDGLLVHSPGSEQQQPTASMAKVITALAIMKKQPLELGQSGPSYTITAEDVANYQLYAAKGGSVVPVEIGTVLTQYQAMQAMLLPSANNIAEMLAERTFGSMNAYVSYANDMLRQMGLSQTIVADASGFSPATISTPSDLVAIGIAALKNPVIAEIVAQPEAQLPTTGVIKNTNELLGVDGVIGIKTGTTDSAGSCLLFAASYESKDRQKVTIVGVIMGDVNSVSLFKDSRALLASAKQGYGLVDVTPAVNTATPQVKIESK